MATSGVRNLTANTQPINTQQSNLQQNTLAAMLAQQRMEATSAQTSLPKDSQTTDTADKNPTIRFGQAPTVTPMPSNPRPPAPNWAMPNDAQNAMEVTRPIIVECRQDKILLRRASGTGVDRDIVIPPGGNTYHVTQTLVSHVLSYIDTWGNAARGTYWQPEMIVTVQPGGEARFEELKSVMHNSGVRIRRK